MLYSIMKNFYLTALFLLINFFAFSQGWYASQNNKKANWETGSAWTKQYGWMDAAPSSTDVAGSYVVNVYGVLTRNGNLTFSGGSTLNVYDTLIIKGNFTVASSVVVHPGGVLIILGNFTGTSSSSTKLVNNGNVVVTGEFSHSGGGITTNDKVYVYDTTPTFGWGASVDGVGYNGSNTAAMGGNLEPKSALNSTPLGNYVNNLMGILPVKLLSFTSTVENNVISLAWITAKEEGFDHFEIERASDDLVFEKIGQINGTGYNTADEHAYALTDNKPVTGKNYYRLKSIDLDGSYEYSSIISAVVETPKSIVVYPNPSNGIFVNVSANFELTDGTEVIIFSQDGVILQRSAITDREARIDFTNRLTPGMYVLKYTSPTYSQTVRLLVK